MFFRVDINNVLLLIECVAHIIPNRRRIMCYDERDTYS